MLLLSYVYLSVHIISKVRLHSAFLLMATISFVPIDRAMWHNAEH